MGDVSQTATVEFNPLHLSATRSAQDISGQLHPRRRRRGGLHFSQNQLDLSGTGNSLDNALSGNNGINVLSGLGGADILLGRGGNDALVDGAFSPLPGVDAAHLQHSGDYYM